MNFILIGYKGGRNDYIMGLNSNDGNSIQEIIVKNVVDVVKLGGYLLINLFKVVVLLTAALIVRK